jgi:hypothetical protein
MAKDQSRADAATATALELFFKNLERRTDDPVHQRLLKAAQKADPSSSIERELAKIMEEILREA